VCHEEIADRSHRYDRLRKELLSNPTADPQSLPYLSAVIKEGLRISMANPTRFPRVVGSSGLNIPGLPSIPPGTSVGLSGYTLHFNSAVFPDPHSFVPERWLEPTPEMLRDSIPFGIGPRQCIARTLATAELYWGVEALVRKDLLRGARPVKKDIEIMEWFNSKVKGEKIELVWDGKR
jgi:cytochrome P450